MSAPKNPRVTLSPEAYHILCVQAAIEQTSTGSLASKAILAYSQEALQVIKREAPSEEGSSAPTEGEREEGREGEGKKPRLSQNPQAITQIKELWASGQRNQAEIAKLIGYHRATVNDNIRRMIQEKELEA